MLQRLTNCLCRPQFMYVASRKHPTALLFDQGEFTAVDPTGDPDPNHIGNVNVGQFGNPTGIGCVVMAAPRSKPVREIQMTIDLDIPKTRIWCAFGQPTGIAKTGREAIIVITAQCQRDRTIDCQRLGHCGNGLGGCVYIFRGDQCIPAIDEPVACRCASLARIWIKTDPLRSHGLQYRRCLTQRLGTKPGSEPA